MTDAALVVEGVRKSFGKLEVLRGIDLALAEHEVVCLIGASGSGKSTLLRIAPDSGIVAASFICAPHRRTCGAARDGTATGRCCKRRIHWKS